MKRSAWWLLMALTVPGLACSAATPVEDSMVVTGTVTVNPAGDVQGYTLYEQDKLPQMVRQIVQDTVPHFQFLPIMVDGKAITAETGMSLRIVVKTTAGAKQGTIRVAAAEFGCDAGLARNLLPDQCPKGTSVSYVRRQPPNYPWAALQARVGGEVFLVLQIDRNGHVSQAAARQVNLYSLTDWPEHYRKVLAEASLRAASKWQFTVPTTGPNAAKDHWVVQVPVNFTMGPCCSATARHYGQWNAYIPGPVQDIPWAGADGAPGGDADAISDNGAPFMKDARFVLKTTLSGDTGQS